MTRITKRLDDLESASGTKGGWCVHFEGEPLGRIVAPEARGGEQISLTDFENEFPDGTIIEVHYVTSDIPA